VHQTLPTSNNAGIQGNVVRNASKEVTPKSKVNLVTAKAVDECVDAFKSYLEKLRPVLKSLFE
jgi:hypothetical protein